MNQCALDNTKIHQLHLAMSNMYSLVISVNYTKDTYSVLASKLSTIPVAEDKKGFKSSASKYFCSCNLDDSNTYPLFCDFDSLIAHLQNNKGVYSFELKLEVSPSIYNWFEGTYFIVDNCENDDLILLLLFKDINDKKLIEENLKDAFKATEIAAKAKTDFLSRMSQDLRTPINLIVSMIDMARNSIDDREKVMDCLIKMDISSRYLFQLIDNVLEMSEIEAGKFNIDNRPFNIRDVLEALRPTYEEQAVSKDIAFKVLIHNHGLNNVIGDAFRLKQIIKNLVSNSFKYVPVKGHVTIELLLNKVVYNRAFFSLIIENDGPSLDENQIDRLFLPFEMGSIAAPISFSRGLGLGLSICKNTVELLGGTITASNTPNNSGVKFEVELSFELDANNMPDTLELLADSAYIRFPESRILVAEEDQQSFETIKALLENRGIKVDLAINGMEAVKAFENSPPDYYNLILMSLELPLMSGLDATKAIRNSFHENGAAIPIIAMTVNVLEQNTMLALQAGVNDHILKPIDVNRLFTALKNYI